MEKSVALFYFKNIKKILKNYQKSIDNAKMVCYNGINKTKRKEKK